MFNPLPTMTYKGKPNQSPASLARKAREKQEIALRLHRKNDLARDRRQYTSPQRLSMQSQIIREFDQHYRTLWRKHTEAQLISHNYGLW